jgi:competence protein ComEC
MPWRAANRVRRLLDGSVDHLDRTAQSLYGGMVLGDARHQPPEVVDDFRGSGLSHVLVVSGSNVAFILVLAGPALRRLGWRGRWTLTLAVVVSFAVVTRFEPSVLRAAAMAIVAVSGQALGRPSPSVRNLALAVTALLLIDPLLVRSVGFQLSVAASAAIAWWSGPLAARLPGPQPLRDALGVTAAAQLGVAPVLIPRFGGLPVAALPANLLAAPVAGLVTTWGLPAGLLSAAIESVTEVDLAPALHLPTQAALRWVADVARVAAALPLGELGPAHAAVAAAGLLLLGARARVVRAVAAAALVVVLLAPAVVLRHPPASQSLRQGVVVERAGGVTEVHAARVVDPVDLLEDLRRAGVRRVDRLVVGGRAAAEVERVVRHRWPVSEVVVQR